MVEFRLLKFNEFEQAIILADQVFRDVEHISMGEAFPQVFAPELNQSYGAFINDELISFIGLVPSIIHVGPAEIQAYSIGAVCTHPNYRKKGYASILLEKVFSHVQKAKASIVFVSGSLPMYQKAGCFFYGELNKYEIDKGDLPMVEGYSIREFLPYDWFALRKLIHSHNVYFEQSIFDFAVLNKSKGFASIHKMEHKIFVAESENDLKGFVVFGVPKSESSTRIIEWGGNPQAVQAILAKSFQFGIKSMKFSIPSHEKELNRLLNSLEREVAPFPGTIKITNLDLLLKQLEPFFSGKIEIVNVDKSTKKLLFHQKSISIDNNSLEKLLLQGDLNLDSMLKDVFPIPLPFPEGLNYV